MRKLPDSISSPQDLTALITELRECARWFSHEETKKRAGVKRASEPPVMSPSAAELVRELEVKKAVNPQSLAELIESLEKAKDTAPTITITLAAPPTSGIKTTLVGWCRKNIAPNVLVAFQFNTTLLGGMVVRSGSHVFDWSFRRKILDGRARFPEVLRNVR